MTNDQFRRQMPITRHWAYLDHAAVAPLSGPARDAVHRWAAEACEQGDTVWSQWAQQVEGVRRQAAALVNARPAEIALIPNTTTGIGLVAEGYPWQAGDNVVTLDNEFPSNLYPWMHLADRGVETRRVPVADGRVDLDRVADHCNSKTRLVAVSWVGYSSGWRLDVDAVVQMAHDRGILVFLDAIQGLGVFPLDVRKTDVDFFAADGHKWMLGPEGAGIFFIKEEHLDRLRPLGIGWNSVRQRFDFSRIELNLRAEAARYEGGSQNMVGMLALGASLELLGAYGLSHDHSAIAQRVLELTDAACEKLEQSGAEIHSEREGDCRSGIVSFSFSGDDAEQLRQQCLQQGVALGCRAGRLRISPHAYNDEDDLERLVAALRSAR